MGLPPLPPHGHPLAGHPGVNGAPHLAGPHHVLTSSASGVIGRPTSTPSTGTNAFNGKLYFLLLSKFEAITHARGQKVYFPSIIGGLLDLLLLSMSTCRIFTIQKFLCVFPILITILLWSFFDCKILGALFILTFFPLSPINYSYICFMFFLLFLWFGILLTFITTVGAF